MKQTERTQNQSPTSPVLELSRILSRFQEETKISLNLIQNEIPKQHKVVTETANQTTRQCMEAITETMTRAERTLREILLQIQVENRRFRWQSRLTAWGCAVAFSLGMSLFLTY